MNFFKLLSFLAVIFLFNSCSENQKVTVSGEMKTWHKITIEIDGPETYEQAVPNPFLDYKLDVTFSKGNKEFTVPGYFAADENAAESSANGGSVWRAHFSPDEPGVWKYEIDFKKGKNIAVSEKKNYGESLPVNGFTGELEVEESDKEGKDFRAKGRLFYTGERYLKHAGTGEYFLKGGADSPENFLAYNEFDSTYYGGYNKQRSGEDSPNLGLHAYEPHVKDWKETDPTWQDGKGKGIIGALNYLAGKNMNSVYFLTMNILGDGEDVWPYTQRNERYRFDCSKLDQWEIVFSHMDSLGIMLHVVLQETENECLLDAGYLDVQRKLYLRELVARFSHHLAITWNLGEEHHATNWSPYGQTVKDTKRMADYLREIDPYDHFIVMHTHASPRQKEKYLPQYLGFENFNGPSIQIYNPLDAHRQTLKWLDLSSDSAHQWVVCIDEIGPHWKGALPDEVDPDHDTIRHNVLWGNLMAGGGGVEWYFGYKFPHGDLSCEDWRSRDNLWEQTAIALDFFHKYLPFHEMTSMDDLVNQEAYCFAKENEVYAVYYPDLSETGIDLRKVSGEFSVGWFNPRTGGELIEGNIAEVRGGKIVDPGYPGSESEGDWVCLLRKI